MPLNHFQNLRALQEGPHLFVGRVAHPTEYCFCAITYHLALPVIFRILIRTKGGFYFCA